MKKYQVIVVSCLLLSVLPYGFAQGSAESSVRGNLSGTVVDTSGAVVQGAKVTITGATGSKTDSTNSGGQFFFPLLTPGFYGIKIEKSSFKTAAVTGIEVVTGKTSNLRVSMVAGQISETVDVSVNAITVDTTSTAVAANLTDTFYQSVPVGRGVTGLFYASPGVASGGGSGTANPSISGGTGLENLYVADGVNITDGGFGGIGVYSRNYGSLSTGINLSFVKEVQVKTGGFEAQYGKSTGGIVQIVTKSGGSAYHGSIGGYFAPTTFEGDRLQTDDFQQGSTGERFNLQGKILHQSNYDVDAEIGGYVPHFKNKIFFFGSFNPQWNADQDQFAQFRNPSDLGTAGLSGPTQTFLGNVTIPVRVYSYAAKLTLKLSDKHQFESSVFGDPTYGDNRPNFTLDTASPTTFDKLQYGTRNFVVRYNGSLTPSWLVNGSFSWGHNNLSDTPSAPGVYQVVDFTQRTPCGSPFLNTDCTATTNPLRGSFTRQGLGYFENTQGDNYGVNLDTSKSFRFLGDHNVSVGYSFAHSTYDGTKARTGANIAIDPATAATVTNGDPTLTSELLANGTNADFQLRSDPTQCIENAAPGKGSEIFVPGLANCTDGGEGVFLRQTRGEFGDLNFKTKSDYHTLYAQDAWSINKYVTINAGLRWEQQHIAGGTAAFTFTDNWSPRVGISIDPWGNRKTKIFANFGRYSEAVPLDIAIRSLSQELDFADTNWRPPTDGAGHVVENPDGTLNLSGLNSATDILLPFNSGASLQTGEAFAPGTRSEYLDEYVVGLEHEFGNSGVIFTARYTDRRIKRIVEDFAALSPEAAQLGLSQQFVIGNPTKTTDVFVNPAQIDFNAAPGDFNGQGVYVGPTVAGCPAPIPLGSPSAGFPYGQPTDSNGNVTSNATGNAICITNPATAGNIGADGIADGFVNPVRVYKSMEFEVNKSFSKNWQLRANYRIAKLFGNYEGSFRNDNAQNDPNISSLFDFTQGDFNLLGQQFTPGVLNTDVRHLVNGFVSYTFGNHYMKGLTMGTSVHFQTGIPINNLFAHPVYANAGEIPFCADNTTNCASARGSLGRTQNYGGVDFHADYPIRITENAKLRLAADLFNITDQRTQLNVDQNAQRTIGIPNADFQKPTGIGPSAVTGNTNPAYQRPFYARFGVKFEF